MCPHWHRCTPRMRTHHHTPKRCLQKCNPKPLERTKLGHGCRCHPSTELEEGTQRESAAVLWCRTPQCSEGLRVRRRPGLAVNSTSVVPGCSPRTASTGKELMCPKPGATSSAEGWEEGGTSEVLRGRRPSS